METKELKKQGEVQEASLAEQTKEEPQPQTAAPTSTQAVTQIEAQTETPGNAEGQAQSEGYQLTQRERLVARMRNAKPQRSWEDEEAFFKAINDDYDEQEILQELYDEQAHEHELALEAAVAAAAHEGEVRGRNLKIEEELRRIRQPEHIHDLDNSPMGATGRYADRPELGALNRVGYQSIWERGREVRIKN